MTGILLLFVFALWILILLGVVRFATIKLPRRRWRWVIRVLLFVVLLPLPLADEILAKPQFEQLCKENSTIQVDRATAFGKTVYLADLPNIQIKGTWVPIRLQPWHYVDAETGELVVSYNVVHATGGWLSQTLGVSEGRVPLIFDGYCAPGGSRATAISLFKMLNIKEIERPLRMKNDNN